MRAAIWTASEQNYQSDRSYPPFFSAMAVKEAWLDPTSGVERASLHTTFPGGAPPAARRTATTPAWCLSGRRPRGSNGCSSTPRAGFR